MKKKIFEEELQIISETGEVIKSKKMTKSIIESEPSYVKMYLQDILYLAGAPKTDLKVLLALLRHVQYGENQVITTKIVREKIAKELGVSEGTVKNAITRLAKAKILLPVRPKTRGVYVLNPYLFGCAPWAQISEMRIQLQIEYDAIRGRTYQAVMNGIQYTEDGLQFQKFMDEIDEIDRELNNIEQNIEQEEDSIEQQELNEEDSQEMIIKVFKEHNIDIDTAPDIIQVLASHPEENIKKIASTVSEMVKNGDITNPVGFLRKDKEWKIKQILEGKIKPNKKTTSKKKWSEYEIYNPHIN